LPEKRRRWREERSEAEMVDRPENANNVRLSKASRDAREDTSLQ
jgi:hypothetical protein